MSSFLSKLREAKEEITIKTHPLVNNDLSFKYSYVIGQAILIYVDENISEKEKQAMQKIHLSLNLPVENTEKAFAIVQQINGEILQEVVGSFSKTKQKVIFLLELYNTAVVDGPITEQELEVIDMFMELLEVEEKFKGMLQQTLLMQDIDEMKRNFGIKYMIRHLHLSFEDVEYIFHITKKEYDKLAGENEEKGQKQNQSKKQQKLEPFNNSGVINSVSALSSLFRQINNNK